MKNLNCRLILVIVFSLFFIPTSQSQFLKKLQKRVEQKVENTVIEKTSDKAADKASKSVDKAFDVNPFGGGGEKADPSVVADKYDFTWKYSLQMTTESGEMMFDYFLKPNASYFGFTSPMMDTMFTVMDNDNNVTAMFMNSGGNNIGMVTKMVTDIDIDAENNENANVTFETLPNKTINGYRCKGVKVTSDDYIMEMYYTNETEVSFDDLFKNSKANVPVKFKDYFKPGEKALMITMDAKSLKNKKQDMKMECVGLEKVSKTIKKSDYKFM